MYPNTVYDLFILIELDKKNILLRKILLNIVSLIQFAQFPHTLRRPADLLLFKKINNTRSRGRVCNLFGLINIVTS